jgi:HPt (histidine-containing phosphotransfer) domain-containing protein
VRQLVLGLTAKVSAPKAGPRRVRRGHPARPLRVVLDREHLAALGEMLSAGEIAGLLDRGEAQLAAVVAALQAAWRRRDGPEIQREAHKLTGLSGSLGCRTLMTAARRIEMTAKGRGLPRRLQPLIDDLSRLLPATVAALRRWRTG